MAKQAHSIQEQPARAAVEGLLSPEQLADLLGISLVTLTRKRRDGSGPPYIKFKRAVRYRPSAVQDWLGSQERRSTAG